MNTILKIICCVATIVAGLMVTVVLEHSLVGMRGAPWTNFYAFEMVLVWGVVALTCATILIPSVSSGVGVGLGNWIRGGGFWAVWSKNNIPGNTWVVLALVLLFNAITYGPPTPTVDWEKFQHTATHSIMETVAKPGTQNAISGAKGAINYLAQGFFGGELIGDGNNQPEKSEKLLPRYEKGWWRIWVALFAILFAPLVWIWGRRNDLADKISAFADRFRAKHETSGSATSGSSGGGMASNLMKQIVGQTDDSSQIANHVIGEFLTRAAEAIFGGFAKLMKRY
mgnify:FL=1